MAQVEGLYQTESFEDSEYRGFAFATEENLDALRKSGHFAIMDSTHKTNKHGWKPILCLFGMRSVPGCPGVTSSSAVRSRVLSPKDCRSSSGGREAGSRVTSSSICRQSRRTPLIAHSLASQQ